MIYVNYKSKETNLFTHVKWDVESGFDKYGLPAEKTTPPDVHDVVSINADGTELREILANLHKNGTPHLGRVLTFDGHSIADVQTQYWYGDDAKFIYSNIILPFEELRVQGNLKTA